MLTAHQHHPHFLSANTSISLLSFLLRLPCPSGQIYPPLLSQPSCSLRGVFLIFLLLSPFHHWHLCRRLSKRRPTPVIGACVEAVECLSLTFPARLAFLPLPHFLFCQGWHLCGHTPLVRIEQITLCFHSGSVRRITSVWNDSTHSLTEMSSTDCAVVIELLTSLLQPTGLEHKALNTAERAAATIQS